MGLSNFGMQLSRLMDEEGLNNSEIARILGVSRQSIANYLDEVNPSFPTTETVSTIAKHFEITEQYFFSNLPRYFFKKMKEHEQFIINFFDEPDNFRSCIEELIQVHTEKIATQKLNEKRSKRAISVG